MEVGVELFEASEGLNSEFVRPDFVEIVVGFAHEDFRGAGQWVFFAHPEYL